MRLAIAGKGGTGKTTLAACLARWMEARDRSVVAVDADPDGNLASALGVPPEEVPAPIAGMRELVRERTDAGEEGWGRMFRLNPRVDDLPERFSVRTGGVRLLVLGTVETGASGCMCPEGAVLKALMQHLLLRIPDDVVLDMEAGLEHLGRASARGVDAMAVVVEPGQRSVQTALRIAELARDLGIRRVAAVLNRSSRPEERSLIEEGLKGVPLVGVLPWSDEVARADLDGRPVGKADERFAEGLGRVAQALEGLVADG